MRKFFDRIRERTQIFMQGRYGSDELNRFMSVIGLVLLLVSLFTKLRGFYLAALAIIILSIIRTYSRNIAKRQKEREWFLVKSTAVTSWVGLTKDRIKYRKTFRFYRCPQCKAVTRIKKPEKGKKIAITCPKCATRFDKRI